MTKFINEYEYTPEIISETLGAWWQRKFRPGYICMIIIFMLILLLSLLKKPITFSPYIVLPLFVMVIFKIRERREIKAEQKRVRALFKNQAPVFKVILAKDICARSPQGETHVGFEKLKNLIVTPNLIILLMEGNMTVALSKKGFQEGTPESCITYLKDYIKK